MKSLLVPVLLALTLSAATAAEPADAPREGDLARLQGLWITKAGPKRNIDVTLEVDGQQAKIAIVTPQGLKFRVHGEVRINENAVPRALDWVKFTGLDEQDLPDVPAIYEFNGESLKVCNGGPNNARPTEFKPGEGILADLLIFEKSKPKDEPPAGPGGPGPKTGF